MLLVAYGERRFYTKLNGVRSFQTLFASKSDFRDDRGMNIIPECNIAYGNGKQIIGNETAIADGTSWFIDSKLCVYFFNASFQRVSRCFDKGEQEVSLGNFSRSSSPSTLRIPDFQHFPVRCSNELEKRSLQKKSLSRTNS